MLQFNTSALRNIFYSSFVILVFLFIGFLSFSFGMHQIGGFDHSAMIETGWRLFNGYQSYNDFFNPFPPGFYLPLLWSYELFGVNWFSLVVINSIFLILSGFAIFFFIYKVFSSKLQAFLLALSCQSLTSLYIGYYWYSSITSIALVFYVMSYVYFLDNKRYSTLVLSLGLFFSFMVKPNSAFLLLFFSIFILFFFKNYIISLFKSIVFSLVLYVSFLAFNDINIFDLIRTYLSLSGRGFPDPKRFFAFSSAEIIINLFFISIMLLPVFFLKNGILFSIYNLGNIALGVEKNKIKIMFSFIVILVSIYGMLSNFEAKVVELPLMMLGVFLLLSVLDVRWKKQWLIVVSFLIIIYGVLFGYSRDRVRLIGDFYENTVLVEVKDVPFFNGVKVGPFFYGILNELEALVSVAEGKKIFFGPRLEFAYAAFNLKSNISFPIWWHPGTSFPKVDQKEIVDRFFLENYDVLVFVKNDFTYYTKDFELLIAERYVEVSLSDIAEDCHICEFYGCDVVSKLAFYRKRG